MYMKDIDESLYSLPVVGVIFSRNYSYFKKHTAFTNAIHIIFGVGIGFIIAGGQLLTLGIVAVFIGLLGHMYAFIKG